MVTTRSQSASPRERSKNINYKDRGNITPSADSSITPSTKKRATPKRTTATSSNQKTSRRKSMVKPVLADEVVVKPEDDTENVNGSGVERRPRSPRKVSKTANGSGEAKVKGKPAHKVDKSGKFDFGGTFGTTSMMIFFPILMYYLWICSTFYGGSLVWRRGSETWLAFADRLIAHVTKVKRIVIA
jgi:hypothetical protein